MSKFRNPFLTVTTIGIICILIICTFLSRTIMNSGRASVLGELPVRTEIYTSRNVTGVVYYENTQRITYDIPLTVTEVSVKSGDKVTQGKVIMEVSNRELGIELKKKELYMIQLNNKIANTENAALLDELRLELEIAEEEIEFFKEKYPADGKIRSVISGVVYEINVAKGETIMSGTMLMSIYDGSSDASVIFYLSEDDAKFFGEGDSAVMHIAETHQNDVSEWQTAAYKNMKITDKEFSLKDNLYKYTIPVQNEFVYHGQELQIQIVNKSPRFEKVLPSQAVYSNDNNEFYVFVVKPKKGIWGDEYQTSKVYVNVLFNNYVNAAIEDIPLMSGERIVVYSPRPIADGEIVVVNVE